jgi:hypothetical protein
MLTMLGAATSCIILNILWLLATSHQKGQEPDAE